MSVYYPSLLMGSLLILLSYFLAEDLFGCNVGLLSAVLVYLDPVVNMCSQKIWMDTTIAFLTVLSVFFFIKALKSRNKLLFILMGISMGLAVNTKYTGGLVLLSVIIYAGIWRRELFSQKYFLSALILPFIMLFPWLYLNYQVYGFFTMARHEELQIFSKQIYPFLLSALVGFFLFYYILIFLKKRSWYESLRENLISFCRENSTKKFYNAGIGAVLLVILGGYIRQSLDFFHEPRTSLRQYAFIDEPLIFYFGRLLEYSFIYCFAYLALFLGFHDKNRYTLFLKMVIANIFLFFICWGNFQSRYILAALPFLIILGAAYWSCLHAALKLIHSRFLAFSGRLMLHFLLIFIIIRAIYLNYNLVYSKIVCYF